MASWSINNVLNTSSLGVVNEEIEVVSRLHQVVVLSKGTTGMANGSNETSTRLVKETAKTQAFPTRAQLSLLPSNIREVNACALCKTATDVQVENA